MLKRIKLCFLIVLCFAESSVGSALYDQIRNDGDMVNFNDDLTIKPKLDNYLKGIFEYKNKKEQLLRTVFDYMLICMYHYNLTNTIKLNQLINNYDDIENLIFNETEKNNLDVKGLNLRITKSELYYLFTFDDCKIYLDKHEFDSLNQYWELSGEKGNGYLYLFFLQLDICIRSAVYFNNSGAYLIH